jgi:hypothetical protein
MASDWWSRRLSDGAPSPQPRTNLPPVTPPMRTAIRVPTETHQPQQAQPQNSSVLDPNRAENENVPMGDAIRLWKGSRAMQRETMTCPDCGSDHVFSRSNGPGINGASPAPQCYTCGWNGKYAQGDQSNWV